MMRVNAINIAILLFALTIIFGIAGWYFAMPAYIQMTGLVLATAVIIYLLVRQLIKSHINFNQQFSQFEKTESYFRKAFRQAALGMALISTKGRYIKVNHALCTILGYSEAELLNISLRHLIHPDDFLKDLLLVRQMIEGKMDVCQSIQRYFNKSGEIIWIRCNIAIVRDVDKHPLYFIAQLQNISSEKKSQEQLKHMAYHDALTGLANRNRLEQHIEEMIIAVRNESEQFALIILDLDYFKNINDSIGHDAGDALLQVVAERLRETVRSRDMVARIGGDEFVIVITDFKKVEVIAQISQKILDHLLKPIMLNGREIYITTSIGISVYPYDGEDIETLMKNADLALYMAKNNGRNNYQFCTSDITQKAKDRVEKQNALSHALMKKEFLLHYQPIIDSKTKQVNSVEALLRWQSKEYGLVKPDSIISIAEESGLIIPLNEWVLRTACLQVKKWHDSGYPSLKLCINLSARQLKSPDFIQSILRILDETQFSARSLILEITEGLIMHDPETTLKILSSLRFAGINIAIDDFGTGFSSFSYLTNYAVDKIKIDRSFINKIKPGSTSVAIVAAMIAMANKLGIKSVAEGVETQEQYDLLVQEGCNEIQGYYISQPLTIEFVDYFLKKHSVSVGS